MKPALVLLALTLLGGVAYIRLAPSDPARWHVAPAGGGAGATLPPSRGTLVTAEDGGARAALAIPGQDPEDVLSRLDRIALATPRTTRLAGSPQEGMITWITRSALFGFPDYTTASARANGPATVLTLHARLRFGRSDFGANAARLRDWLSQLAP